MTDAARCITFGAVALALGSGSCKKTKSTPAPTASARTQPSASAASKPKPKPWYVGHWSGSYRAVRTVFDMTVKQGAIPQWGKDSGRRASGPGTLALDVDDHGRITGTLSGPLGPLLARGDVDGDQMRVRLSAKDPKRLGAFNGNLLATRDGDEAKGQLRVATGDSLTLRHGPVLLRKGAQAPPPPPAPPPPASSAPSSVAARGGAASK